ncbi:sugar transferase [Demequina zhanjiangensis]|uniref:Sugar transferase n=1 Tax=Demequina zhanjiangensis TaxID=3051659 RepID=A0ABT8FYQ8_9MICO|nr:sugar transferase [Demequina sp. SYSU T00b26]MDN4472028.1 sugar transferase [Demequina sp. SYSU T00b26]
MNSRRGGGSAGLLRGRSGWAVQLRIALALSDAFVVALVMVIAQYTRFGVDPNAAVTGSNSFPYATLSVAIGVLWWVLLGLVKSREVRILGHGPQEFQRVFRASLGAFLIVAVVGFVTQWQISRSYLLVALPVGMIAIMVYRLVWRTWVHAERQRGRLLINALVIGPTALAADVADRLSKSQLAGYRLAGVARIAGTTDSDERAAEMLVIDTDTNLVELARSVGAEVIVVAGSDAKSNEYARRLGWQLEGTDIGLIVAPALAEVAGPRVLMTPVQGLPLMHVDSPEFTGAKYWAKSAFDRLLAALMLLVGAIPMLVVAILIKVTSPGPVFFRQERVGLGMQHFRMFKFRSMYADAEERLKEIEDLNEGNGVHFKMKDDPRVTPIGRFIRRYSIDELPQLFNVLIGDMSLVGPRPPLPREVEAWEGEVQRRQLVKPGMTGLWQVSGRSDLSWEEAVRLDLYYAENWSPAGDTLILLRTFTAVFGRSGAY